MESQQLTIFLSSPFNGLRFERDVFINRHLPFLRRKAQQQGIHVKIIDLRWGISTQELAKHMAVWICLKNVAKCDMFLGFYGARYGTVYNPHDSRTSWVKSDFDFAQKDFPWVDMFRTRAVTELEFRYGWLNHNMPNGIGNARGLRPAAFFFRNPAYDKRMEKEDPENAYAYRNHDAVDVEKLSRLKLECEECAPTSNYDDPTKVAEQFRETCEGWMARMLPKEEDATKFGRENGAHIAFQSARCVTCKLHTRPARLRRPSTLQRSYRARK